MPPATDTKTDTVINLTDRELSKIPELYRIQYLKWGTGCLQIGSYLCGNYLRALCAHFAPSELPETYDLVLPVLAQHDLSQLEEKRTKALIHQARTIVVNDPGMLLRFSSRKNVRLGRLFFRTYRDHRYPYYETGAAEDKLRPLTAALRDIGCNFCSVEREAIGNNPPHTVKDELISYCHLPYRLVSGIRICEYASAGKEVSSKFIPDDRCHLQCLHYCLRYEDEEFDNAYIKWGRGLYDLVPKGSAHGQNLIITPEFKEEDKNEHHGSARCC